MPNPGPTGPLELSPELLHRYTKPGPRYTSYPTAPEWSRDFGALDYRKALARAAERPDEPLSLYVHLPFCRTRCAYCGCNAMPGQGRESVAAYLDRLRTELDLVGKPLEARRTLAQLHWGGGTPTYLTPDELRALYALIAERFAFVDGAEVAIEIDPRTATGAHIDALGELGFNRVSMGVQDLDPIVQGAIRRFQSEEQVAAAYQRCRDWGFRGVNMDLVYGLPGQRLERWRRTIQQIIAMRPDRLAVYGYAHLPERLCNQRDIDADAVPGALARYELLSAARALLLEGGYVPIGMDHYALPEDELAVALEDRRLNRNFMGYTVAQAKDVLGAGLSAIAEIGGCYSQNYKDLSEYEAALESGELPVRSGKVLSRDDRIRKWVIRQLMCNFVVDYEAFRSEFGVDFTDYFAEELKRLDELRREGFVEIGAQELTALPLGRVFVRNIAMVFDAYLNAPNAHRSYSKTV